MAYLWRTFLIHSGQDSIECRIVSIIGVYSIHRTFVMQTPLYTLQKYHTYTAYVAGLKMHKSNKDYLILIRGYIFVKFGIDMQKCKL